MLHDENYACDVMYCKTKHSWRHIFLCCSVYVPPFICSIFDKSFDFCVSMFLCSQGYVLWCAISALVTLINQGSSGNQSAFKQRPFTVQMQKEELCLLLLFDFIAQCVCMWVLKPVHNASASARQEKRTPWCMNLKCWRAWKGFIEKNMHSSKLASLCHFCYYAN
jgi:hypothetical protein